MGAKLDKTVKEKLNFSKFTVLRTLPEEDVPVQMYFFFLTISGLNFPKSFLLWPVSWPTFLDMETFPENLIKCSCDQQGNPEKTKEQNHQPPSSCSDLGKSRKKGWLGQFTQMIHVTRAHLQMETEILTVAICLFTDLPSQDYNLLFVSLVPIIFLTCSKHSKNVC